MDFSTFKSTWSGLHNNASTQGIVGGWLRISFALAQGANTLRLTPNSLTLLGVFVASAALINSWWALFLVPLSLAFDGVDGSLAIITGRESKVGAIYDSLSDRIVEGFWAYIAYQLGAPLWVAASLWSLGALQEYARARIAALGVGELGVVTVMERPMRASALFISLVLSVLSLPGVVVTFYCALLLQLFSVLAVFRFGYQSLQQPSQR